MQEHSDSITFLQRLCDKETSVYAKASSVLAQLLLMKTTFHKQYKEFSGTMGSHEPAARLISMHGKDLVMRLLELQQLNIACLSVVLSLTKAMPAPAAAAKFLRLRQPVVDQSQSCLLWSVQNVVLESVSIYETCFQLMLYMATHGKDTAGVAHMFRAQHLKLKSTYATIRGHPYLSSKLYTLDLGPTAPDFAHLAKDSSASAAAVLPSRVQPNTDLLAAGFSGASSAVGTSSAPNSPAVSRRATASGNGDSGGRSGDGSGESGGGDGVMRRSESRLMRDMQHEQEVLKATIASLEDHIRNLTSGLTHVDPDVIAAMQSDAIGVGDAKARDAHGRVFTLAQRYEQTQEENERLSAQVQELQEQLEQQDLDASTMTQDLQQQVEQARHQADMLQAHVASLTDIRDDLQKQLDDADAAAQQQREDAAATRATVARLQQQLAQASEALDAAESERGADEAALDAADRREHDLTQQVDTLRGERDSARAECELLRAQLATMTKERNLLSARVAELKQDLAGEEARRAEVEAALDAAEARAEEASTRAIDAATQEVEVRSELQDLNRAHAETREQVLAVQQERDALKKEVASLKSEGTQRSEAHEKAVVQLKEELRARDQKIVQAVAQDATSAREIETLQAKLQAASDRAEATERELSEARRQGEQLGQELDALREAKAAVEAKRVEEAAAAEKQATALQERVEGAQREAKEAAAKLQQETAARKADSTAAAKQISTLQAARDEAASTVEQLQARVEGLEREAAAARSQHAKEAEALQRECEASMTAAQVQLKQEQVRAQRTLAEVQTRTAGALTDAVAKLLPVWQDDGAGVLGKLSTEAEGLKTAVASHLKRMQEQEEAEHARAASGGSGNGSEGSVALRSPRRRTTPGHSRRASLLGGNGSSDGNSDADGVMAQVVRVGALLSHACAHVRAVADEECLPSTHESLRQCDAAIAQFQDVLFSLRGGGVEGLSTEGVAAFQNAVAALADSNASLQKLQHNKADLLEQQMADATTVRVSVLWRGGGEEVGGGVWREVGILCACARACVFVCACTPPL